MLWTHADTFANGTHVVADVHPIHVRGPRRRWVESRQNGAAIECRSGFFAAVSLHCCRLSGTIMSEEGRNLGLVKVERQRVQLNERSAGESVCGQYRLGVVAVDLVQVADFHREL